MEYNPKCMISLKECLEIYELHHDNPLVMKLLRGYEYLLKVAFQSEIKDLKEEDNNV